MSWSTINDSHSQVWPQISQALCNKYQITAWVDLLANDTDIKPEILYNQLQTFANKSFEPNQRAVILHRDNDYYCNEFGFTMWNIYKIFSSLNIASEYFILLTAFKGIETENKKLAEKFNVPPMQVIYSPYQWCPQPEFVNPIEANQQQIQYPYVCLNGVPRSHRVYVLAQLQQQDILDAGMISLWPGRSESKVKNLNLLPANHPVPKGIHLRTNHPPTRINDELDLSPEQSRMFHQLHGQIVKPRTHHLITNRPNNTQDRYQPEFLQASLWNLVTESVGQYPYGYFTEKTFKAILTKRPFILLGGNDSLQDLHSLGFRSFNQWIDEDYAKKKSFADRADHAVKVLKPFCSMTPQQLQEFYQELLPVVEHNFNNYMYNFGNKQLEDLINRVL
jgi:hypothetical protein